MAKKITNPESEAVEKSETPETQPENTEQPTPAPESQKEEPEKEPEAPMEPEPEPKTTGAEKPSEEVPVYADRIMKNNPAYAQLYIDAQGGTFTVNTPPALRRTATLYTNPYHKRS